MSRHKTEGSSALQERKVIVIEAAKRPEAQKLRVAAYCRVSSDSSDQLNSFMAQTRYYTDLISSNGSWTMADIYADEGISGTSIEKRPEFQRLLADCRRGRVDRILVKSISRFARNTKECLKTIRSLKAIGVGVCFEEQNIDTSQMSGELLAAMFAAIAQKESESISENQRWSYQYRMENEKFITCKAPFGYRLHENTLEVYEPEAKIVREIFSRYLQGDNKDEIAQWLSTLGVKTRDGKDRWQHTTISYMLRNERYIGNSLLQKRYTTDSFPHQKSAILGNGISIIVPPAIRPSSTERYSMPPKSCWNFGQKKLPQEKRQMTRWLKRSTAARAVQCFEKNLRGDHLLGVPES